MTDKLNPNDDLAALGSITSQDGGSTLVMQGDGNLVLYRSGGKARWATGTDGRVVSQAVMQGDGNFVMYGPGGGYIWDSATDGHPGASLVLQNDGNVVIYDPAGTPLWATNTDVARQVVPGFLPSTSGFHFSNGYGAGTSYPVVTLPIVGTIVSGDAGNGLCGGFALATLDLFCHAPRLQPPPDTARPPAGSPIFNYLVARLLDSFGSPLEGFPNAARVIEWIQTPGHDVTISFYGAGLARRMIEQEWPKIRKDIDSGAPSPLNLVASPERGALDVPGIVSTLHHCHQVLAYGYELDGGDLTLRVYDCNDPFNDNSTISVSIGGDPAHTIAISAPAVSAAIAGGADFRGFFRTKYDLHDPSAIASNAPVALTVTVHLEGIGDSTFHADELAGTRGQSRRLEGFSIRIDPPVAGLSMQYCAHLQDIGDVPWVDEGDFVGTRGQSRRLEGFQIRLIGPAANLYTVSYMAHLQDIGDTSYVSDGQFCGTRGESRRVEGISVRVNRR